MATVMMTNFEVRVTGHDVGGDGVVQITTTQGSLFFDPEEAEALAVELMEGVEEFQQHKVREGERDGEAIFASRGYA